MNRLVQFGAAIVAGGCVLALAVIVALPSIALVITGIRGSDGAIDVTSFRDYAVRSQVFGANGELIATLHGPENREPMALADMPDTIKQAVLSVEDAQFYA
ncbi:MAG: hypothetical protein ACKOIA_04790, partial [Acidimicrobiia bacterium]